MKSFLVAVFFFLFAFPLAAETQTIKVGISSNFSEISLSSANPYGNYFRNGIYLAILDNQKRLMKRGLRLDVQEFDYGTSPLRVIDAAKRAVASPVIGVVGYNFSSHALMAAPIHQEGKLPMITPSATADRLGKFGAYVHLSCYDNSYMGRGMAMIARKRLKARKAALVVAADCAYCQDLARAFREEFEKNSGKVTAVAEILEGDLEFSKTIALLRSTQHDVIVIPNQELISARVIAALLNAGFHKPFLGGDGWGDVGDKFFAVLGKADLEGYSISHWHQDMHTPRSDQFIRNYLKQYHKLPNDTAALAYDAMSLLIEGLVRIRNGEYTRKELEKSISGIKEFIGVTGRTRFISGSAPAKNLVLLSTDRRRFKFVASLSPEKLGLLSTKRGSSGKTRSN